MVSNELKELIEVLDGPYGFVADLERLIEAEATKASDEGFREGQRVGQYQASDKLYHYVVHLALFMDSEEPKIQARIPEWITDMTKQCEKYMNHNAKIYHSYVRGERYKRFRKQAHPNTKENI